MSQLTDILNNIKIISRYVIVEADMFAIRTKEKNCNE